MKKFVKSNKNYYVSIILMMLAVIFWGVSFTSTKIILRELPPISIAFFRQIIASAILVFWLACTRSFVKVSIKDLLIISASGFFGIVLYFVFENIGLKYTTASNASIIVASVPIFTLITEALFYKLKINFKMISCIIVSIIGVYLVITVNGQLNFSSSMFLGNILVVGAMVAWVVYTMLNKGLGERYPSLVLTAYQSIASIFLFIPFIVSEIPEWEYISLTSMLNLVYLGVFCSALSYFFYIYATKKLGATTTATYLNLIPVVTIIAGFFVLGEKLSIMQIAGMSLIMFSLYPITNRR